jgi:hypothetical protein
MSFNRPVEPIGFGNAQTNDRISNVVEILGHTPKYINIFNTMVTARMLIYNQELETASRIVAVRSLGDPDMYRRQHIDDEKILSAAEITLSTIQHLERISSIQAPERLPPIQSAIHYLTLSIEQFRLSRNAAYGGRKNKSKRKNKKSRKSRKSRK